MSECWHGQADRAGRSAVIMRAVQQFQQTDGPALEPVTAWVNRELFDAGQPELQPNELDVYLLYQ